MPQQLVMFMSLMGLCFLPLQMMCLACKYFKLSVNCAFTCQVLFFHIYLSQYVESIILVCLLYLPVFCWECVNKLRLPYECTPKYLGESVTGTEFGLRKRQRGSDAFIVIRDSGMDASRCADELQYFQCTCAVVFPLEDQSRWLWHH